MERKVRINFSNVQINRIIELYLGGSTIAEIAEEFEVNRDVIRLRLKQNNVRIRKNGEWQIGKTPANYIDVSSDIEQFIVNLWNDNFTLLEIKESVIFNENKIRGILIKNGIDTSRRRKKEANATCFVCNKKYRKRPSRIKTVNCCSKECRGLSERKRVIIHCDHCKQEISVIPYYESIRKYCSQNCASEASKTGSIGFCENCGKTFYKTPGRDKKYCSTKCTGDARITAIDVSCSWCKKIIKKNLCHVEKQDYLFCSYNCAYQFRKYDENFNKEFSAKISKGRIAYYKEHPEARSEQSKRMIKAFSEGTYPRTKTIPHNLVCGILKQLNINYKEEFPTGPYVSDIFLLDFNVVIEIQGTYWHADNRTYPDRNSLNKVQKSNIERDKEKQKFIIEKLNFKFIELWELDIKRDYYKVREFLSELKDRNFNCNSNIINYLVTT